MSEYRLAEKPALDALTAMGYVALHHEAAMSMRQEANRVLLKPVLIEALQALNDGLGVEDAEAIYSDLSTLSDNEEWQRRLRGAYSRRLKGATKDKPVALIDFKRSGRNRYHVVRQFKVEAQRSRIADLVVFVNGIPLVVIEAKCPLKAADRSGQAFEQIKQYERDIPRLFYRVALAEVIAADLVKDGMDEADAETKADRMIACVFSKSQEDNKPSEDAEIAALRSQLEAHYLDDEGEKAAKKAFKSKTDEPSFLIVCDKLLTGFDAPNEHVMYLDRPLREHGLLQAIARTNRTCSIKRPDGSTVDKPHGRIVDYIGVTQHLDDALSSYRADDVQNALRDLDLLRRDLRKTHAEFKRQLRLLGLDCMEEKAAAYAIEKLVADGREDDWFELQRLGRHFVRTYGDLSPDPAILDFTEDMKWAATFLRLAQQAITKDESLDHLSYSGKIRDMLEEHVRATGLTTTVRLRNITDPEFKGDFDTEEKSDEELHEAFVRKAAELKRVTRELVDRNPAQYGRFSERVLEIIRRFEEGQIAAAEGLKDFEDLTGGIEAEASAHAEMEMDERAFAILRIIEPHVTEAYHAAIQAVAVEIGGLYAQAQASQPSWFFMDGYKKELRRKVRKFLRPLDLSDANPVRDEIEAYAVHAYAEVR